ncbi:MerR family transcriptional regulator [Streptomyces sp. TLI_171]|uniref:MerR family transcriptional regulator n=1 Tax=Streptomyces sp. TLI_171 TaxID=1938859 RepID=UPI000C176798|nr:MerR family transcriptional regulator [Streptomyces sp. TLI_171]
MRIGELSRATGVPVRLLRYYEQQELLAAHRTPGGHREYRADAPLQVGRIRALLAAGLTTRTIRELLPCYEDGELHACVRDRLTAQLAELNARIGELTTARDALADLTARVPQAA